jgi:hypothetical protein
MSTVSETGTPSAQRPPAGRGGGSKISSHETPALSEVHEPHVLADANARCATKFENVRERLPARSARHEAGIVEFARENGGAARI